MTMGVSVELQASFVRQYEAAQGTVWGVVKAARLEDEEAVVAEVWARAWAH